MPAPARAWTIETVASGGVGAHSDIAVDASDGLHIAHFGGGQGKLYYAFDVGGGWTNEMVDAQFLTGHLPSIAVDSSGIPHIAYFYYSGHRIRYASRNGGAWSFSEFETDDEMEWDISMALDAADRPHVSYQNGNFQGEPHDLKYATHDGTQWVTTIVDAPGQVGRGSAIAVDSAGRPWISYYDETNVRLKVAHHDGAQWIVETVDPDVQFIGFNFRTSIAIDRLDRVHVAYGAYQYDGANWRGRLRYALDDEAGWTVTTLEVGAPNRDFRVPSIAVDRANHPRISYLIYYNVEPITADLKYARFDGTAWTIEVVDPGDIADSDYSNSIAVDSRGAAHISYGYNQTSLRHAAGEIPAGTPVDGIHRLRLVALDAPYPNPARGEVTLAFTLPEPSDAALDVFDAMGVRVAALMRRPCGAGRNTWTGTLDLPPGVYACRLHAAAASATAKLVIRPR
jgi:hypothetical protein